MKINTKNDQRGASSLILVLIVGAAALLAAHQAAVLVQNSADIINISLARTESDAYASACLETGLYDWLISDEYAIQERTIVFSEGECTFSSHLENGNLLFEYSGHSRDSYWRSSGEAAKNNGRISILNLTP